MNKPYYFSSSVKRFNQGFTLVELLVTIAIAAIIISVGAPSFSSLITSNDSDNAIRRVAAGLAYARSEAVSRGVSNIYMCPSSNGVVCSTDWSDGWLVFADMDGDFAPDAGEPLRFDDTAVSSSVSLTVINDNNNAAVALICFDSYGAECGDLSLTFSALVGGVSEAGLEVAPSGIVSFK